MNIIRPPIAIMLIATIGIGIAIFNIKIQNSHKIKWNMLQAQQASLNALAVAKDMLRNNCLQQNCLNTSGCPFWSEHPKIRAINPDGAPNTLWWHSNAYAIQDPINNARFIIIKKPNNLYKIMSFAENLSKTQAIISTGYFLNHVI